MIARPTIFIAILTGVVSCSPEIPPSVERGRVSSGRSWNPYATDLALTAWDVTAKSGNMGSRRLLSPAPPDAQTADSDTSSVRVRLSTHAQSVPGILQDGSDAISLLLVPPVDAKLEFSGFAPRDPNTSSSDAKVEVWVRDDDGTHILWSKQIQAGDVIDETHLDLTRFGNRAVRLEFTIDDERTHWVWVNPRVMTREGPTAPIPDEDEEHEVSNIILVVLDALTRDRMGLYGGTGATTPTLDRLGDESLVFDDVHAQASYTLSSTATLLSSTTPAEHLVLDKNDRLAPRFVTLAEALRGAGYATALLSGNGWVSPQVGMAQGFDYFVDLPENGGFAIPEQVNSAMAGWLDALQEDEDQRPFFAYLHYLQPHEPLDLAPDEFYPGGKPVLEGRLLFEYRREVPSSAKLEQFRSLYEGNLRYADAGIRELLELLRSRGLLDETLLVVTSDHGEALGERGLTGHNLSVDEVMTAIPLLIRFPSADPPTGRVGTRAGSIDIAPTILSAVGVSIPEGFRGIDLLARDETPRGRVLYARSWGTPFEAALWFGDFKYVYESERGSRRLMKSDWTAPENHWATYPITGEYLDRTRFVLEDQIATAARTTTNEISEETIRALQGLGYLVE